MTCENQELIVSYIYDDLTIDEKRSFDAHLAVCEACRAEVASLRATRGHLSLWAPPQPDFAFRIVREQAPAKVVSRHARWVPPFALAAAAVLVLAVATAIANLEVRYDANGFIVRTGWQRDDRQMTQSDPRANNFGVEPASASVEFAALDRRLRQLELATASQPSQGAIQTASARLTDGEILRRVREIVTEAESRQQTAVAKQLLQLVNDFDRQRERDLAAIQQGLGAYQGVTNAEIAQQRDMLQQLYRVASRQEK